MQLKLDWQHTLNFEIWKKYTISWGLSSDIHVMIMKEKIISCARLIITLERIGVQNKNTVM